MKKNLYGHTLERLGEAAAEAGLPAYAGRQIADWLYRKDAASVSAMSNLPLRARKDLAERYDIHRADPVKVSASTDGTRKYLFPAENGGFVEAAWIPDRTRSTLCLSVQVGCKMGCLFCMTGKQYILHRAKQ